MTGTHRRPGRPRRFVCPPSSQKVLQALDDAGQPLDPRELQEASHLPRRTMYVALECLSKLGLVKSGTTLHDTRRSRYALDPSALPRCHGRRSRSSTAAASRSLGSRLRVTVRGRLRSDGTWQTPMEKLGAAYWKFEHGLPDQAQLEHVLEPTRLAERTRKTLNHEDSPSYA